MVQHSQYFVFYLFFTALSSSDEQLFPAKISKVEVTASDASLSATASVSSVAGGGSLSVTLVKKNRRTHKCAYPGCVKVSTSAKSS